MSSSRSDDGMYECLDCGDRPENPKGRRCPCGGYLQNIGVSRSM